MSIPRSVPLVWPWLNGPPPSGTGPGRVPGGYRWSCWIGHTHLFRPQPNPGADAFAYEALGLVEFSPIGPGDVNRDALRPVSEGTLYAGQALAVQGLGGLVTGQVISAPLIVPNELQSVPLGLEPLPPSDWVGLPSG